MKYCNEYVCLFVCLYAHITKKPHCRTTPNFYACCLWSWLTVLLRRHCDVLCTSGFVDDVMFLQRIMCIAKWRQNATNITVEISTKFFSTIKTGSTNCELGKLCSLRLLCFSVPSRDTNKELTRYLRQCIVA